MDFSPNADLGAKHSFVPHQYIIHSLTLLVYTQKQLIKRGTLSQNRHWVTSSICAYT